jgi:hypothetical protein
MHQSPVLSRRLVQNLNVRGRVAARQAGGDLLSKIQKGSKISKIQKEQRVRESECQIVN